MTCVGNDFSFNEIFSRYVEAMGCKGDVLLAISTSGHSENILKAAVQAHNNGMKVIALTSKERMNCHDWQTLQSARHEQHIPTEYKKFTSKLSTF